MLEPLGRKQEADLMREIAHPLPVRVIAAMLGLPGTMQGQLEQWSDAIAQFMAPTRTLAQAEAAQRAVVGLRSYFRDAVAERRRHKGTDLISLILEIEENGDVLTEEEVYAQCVMLLFGGHETTRNLIGNGIYTLLGAPEEAARLREEPALIRSAVEELLRLESPVQFTARIVKEEMELFGVVLQPGEIISFILAAANRDGRQFDDPDRLDLGRMNNAHLAFGAGPHFCIGNQIARMEGQAAILELVRRFPRMQLAAQAPEWVPNYNFRGLKTLPVNL
jgi:cytochrome P450